MRVCGGTSAGGFSPARAKSVCVVGFPGKICVGVLSPKKCFWRGFFSGEDFLFFVGGASLCVPGAFFLAATTEVFFGGHQFLLLCVLETPFVEPSGEIFPAQKELPLDFLPGDPRPEEGVFCENLLGPLFVGGVSCGVVSCGKPRPVFFFGPAAPFCEGLFGPRR